MSICKFWNLKNYEQKNKIWITFTYSTLLGSMGDKTASQWTSVRTVQPFKAFWHFPWLWDSAWTWASLSMCNCNWAWSASRVQSLGSQFTGLLQRHEPLGMKSSSALVWVCWAQTSQGIQSQSYLTVTKVSMSPRSDLMACFLGKNHLCSQGHRAMTGRDRLIFQDSFLQGQIPTG